MYCYKCGKKIRDDSDFCSGCGTKIKEEKSDSKVKDTTEKRNEPEKRCWRVFAKLGFFIEIAVFALLQFAGLYESIDVYVLCFIVSNISMVFSILGVNSRNFKKTSIWGICFSATWMVISISACFW